MEWNPCKIFEMLVRNIPAFKLWDMILFLLHFNQMLISFSFTTLICFGKVSYVPQTSIYILRLKENVISAAHYIWSCILMLMRCSFNDIALFLFYSMEPTYMKFICISLFVFVKNFARMSFQTVICPWSYLKIMNFLLATI